MDQGLALVVAGVVTGISAIIVALIQTLRRENRRDHAVVASNLIRLHNALLRTAAQVGRVDEKLDAHIAEHHREGDTRDGAARRDARRERKQAQSSD